MHLLPPSAVHFHEVEIGFGLLAHRQRPHILSCVLLSSFMNAQTWNMFAFRISKIRQSDLWKSTPWTEWLVVYTIESMAEAELHSTGWAGHRKTWSGPRSGLPSVRLSCGGLTLAPCSPQTAGPAQESVPHRLTFWTRSRRTRQTFSSCVTPCRTVWSVLHTSLNRPLISPLLGYSLDLYAYPFTV